MQSPLLKTPLLHPQPLYELLQIPNNPNNPNKPNQACTAPDAQLQTNQTDQPLAGDFAGQLRHYLQHCLRSSYQYRPAQDHIYRHEALQLLLQPFSCLQAQTSLSDAELERLMSLWLGQSKAWQESLNLRSSILNSRIQTAGSDTEQVPDLHALISARGRLDTGYAECDRLALLLDRLERGGLPGEVMQSLEKIYIDVLLELDSLQAVLEPFWISMA